MPNQNFTIPDKLATRKLQAIKNIVGQSFGRLTVFSCLGSRIENNRSRVYWLCRCRCGVFTVRRRSNLFPTASCGCARQIHGLYKMRAFHSWSDMMRRCYDPQSTAYSYYGGRGIKVCERWHQAENFVADMGERPTNLTLERINTNGDYEPNNCKWDTMKAQGRNKRNNRLLTYKGITLTVAAWEEMREFRRGTINNRLRYGWSVEHAITLPVSAQKYTTRKKLIPPPVTIPI